MSARILLGLLRLTFGSLALAVPGLLVGRAEGRTTDLQGSDNPAAVYAFRMFGIRTVLIGRALLLPEGPQREAAVREAPLIHASDTATATLLTVTGRVPRRAGLGLVAISGLNTVLAVLAVTERRRR